MTHSGSRGSPHHENIVARSVTPQRAMRLPGMRMVDRGLAASAMTLILAACTSTSPTGPARTPAPPPGTLVAPSAAEASTVTPSARPTRTTTPTPRADGWRPVPDQTTVQGIQFLHVIWTGRRFVATGLEFDAGGVFLDSSDGITWHLQAGAYPEAGPGHLAVGSRGLVAVSLGAYRASWFSTDGLAWTTRADPFPLPLIGSDTVEVTDVVATGDGWLAVGREDPPCQLDCGLAPVRAIVWTSSDGLHWTRVPDQPSLRHGAMTGVARMSSGFVAVGSVTGRAAAWTSTNGSTWTAVPDEATFQPLPGTGTGPEFWAEMSGVAVGHGVVVGVGGDGARGGGGGSARAWWSADGRSWTEATGDRFAGGQIFGVTATPEGFLATGPSGEQSCLGGIWASTDGRAWQCVASDPAFADFGPYAATASSSVEVAVGLKALANPPPAGLPGAVWWRPLP
jgi:hypothetical protein